VIAAAPARASGERQQSARQRSHGRQAKVSARVGGPPGLRAGTPPRAVSLRHVRSCLLVGAVSRVSASGALNARIGRHRGLIGRLAAELDKFSNAPRQGLRARPYSVQFGLPAKASGPWCR